MTPGRKGCRYYNSDIRKVVLALHPQLQNRRLDTKIEVVEAGDIGYLYEYPNNRGDYIDAFFDRDSPYYIGDKVAYRICSHSYFTCWPEDGRLVSWRQKIWHEAEPVSGPRLRDDRVLHSHSERFVGAVEVPGLRKRPGTWASIRRCGSRG